MLRTSLIMAFCFVAFPLAPVSAAEPALPELKPLDRFVGSWTGSVEGTDITSESETEWILGGRFLQQKYSTSAGEEGMILRTYDPNTKKYAQWMFDSNGGVVQQTGTWDAETNTLTVEGQAGGVLVVTKAHFPKPDTEEWSISVQDRDGKVLREFKGKNVRKGKR